MQSGDQQLASTSSSASSISQPLSPPARPHPGPQIQFYSSPPASFTAQTLTAPSQSQTQYPIGPAPVSAQQAPALPPHLLPGAVSPPAQSPAPAALSVPPPPPIPAITSASGPGPAPSATSSAAAASTPAPPPPAAVARTPPCVQERSLEQLARQVDPFMQLDEDVSQVRGLSLCAFLK